MASAQTKAIRGWMAYDWASQPFHTLLVTFFFGPYFIAFVASDEVSGQAMWSLMLTCVGLAIALSAPILGAIADHAGPRKPWIAVFSIAYVISTAALWYAVPGSPNTTWILLTFAIAFFSVELTLVFTNAYLPSLAPESELGKISGNGWAVGYLAGLATVILVLALIYEDKDGLTLLGNPPIFGLDPSQKEGVRFLGPLTSVWYVIFIIPFFLWVPEAPRKVGAKIGEALSSLWQSIRQLPQNPSLFAYLGSSMFYRDALNGLYQYGGIIALGVLGWSQVNMAIFALIILISGALGSFLGGKADAKFGSKPVVTVSIIVLMITTALTILTTRQSLYFMPLEEGSTLPDIMFFVYGILIGAFGGIVQASSRTLLVGQVEDKDRMTESFGLYALAGKATAFIAPATIGVATVVTGSQSLGIFPLIVLFLIGLVLLYRVRT